MTDQDERLNNRLALLTDESLVEMAERKSNEYTPEALRSINEEVARRGGLEYLKKKVQAAQEQGVRPADVSEDSARRLAMIKRWYPFLVVLAYTFFMYAIKASLWLYWLMLFALIAWLLAVLFKPPYKPQDEIRELLEKAAAQEASQPGENHPTDQSPE